MTVALVIAPPLFRRGDWEGSAPPLIPLVSWNSVLNTTIIQLFITIFNYFRNYQGYLAITGHYISKSFELKRFLVYCGEAKGKHTSEMIAHKVDEIIDILDLPEFMFKAITIHNR